ncbi:MAG TPA: S8 family serine peptidase [Pyrinomonadaceae bacterium]|nr:S8 family serine peptidase [Pyrinomonadaceae bacterium]
MRFREGVTDAAKADLVASKAARHKGKLRGESRLERVELRRGQDAAAVASELGRDPRVEFAEPNYLFAGNDVTPGDTRYGEQWALHNVGQSGGTPGSDVRAAAAWQESSGALSTVVAVLDSGIDFEHPDLKNNRWVNRGETPGNGADDDGDGLADDVHGWDWVADSGFVRDEQGHGTSVAGVIAAEGDNGKGVSGVMWRASLMSLRVLDSTGTGDVADAVEAIDYAVAHGASVVNCSWGMDADSRALRDAIERAGRKGVVVVASAGNSGRDLDAQPYYPASYDLPNLIAVASSDGFDNLAPFSNRGAVSVAVAAPGTDILTTQAGGDYRYVSGTSASAPIVTGIVGLIKTVRPNVTVAAARAAVLDGARRVDALTGKVSSGGVADAAGALATLRGGANGNNGGDGQGEGQGNDGGNGQGNGEGGGQPGEGQSYIPPSLRKDNEHGRAQGKDGLVVEAPATLKGAPAEHLPNLVASRKARSSNPAPAPAGTIKADLMCADCDPSGGGGGGGSYPTDPYFGTARTRPSNGTGTPGVNLGSRNFNWELPVVSLPGRAGLDLSLTLYYNSLVWTKQGTSVQYNTDHGTPAPGFQLGLPRLQPQFYNSDAGAYAYIMVTPSGGRIEMRQTGTTGVYESSDSSYTQLTFPNGVATVRNTDGTQYVFGQAVANGAEFRCTQIKDRNGNYISASYDSTTGHLISVTDTLGRVVNFNYDGNGNLSTIRQTWGGATHTYATFIYTSRTMSLNFPGLSVYGAQNGASQTVLDYVVFPDNASYHFAYNGYGQVYKITHVAPDGHELAHTRYNMADADLNGAAQSDCPRFTTRYNYAQDWNSNQEAATTYSATTGVQWQNPETLQTETGTLVQQTSPDGVTYKQYSHSTGWDAGLPRLSEVWANENGSPVKKKWTSQTWTQDNNSLLYTANPRISEVNVYDGVNRQRTTIEYNSGYGLPTHVREYGGANGQTLLRFKATSYKLDADYVNRRVIGLPYERLSYDSATGALMSKQVYHYDWGGWHLEDIPNVTIPQHDPAYSPSFASGRGNLVLVQRFDVNDPTSASNTLVEFKYRYNKTGSMIGTMDPGFHQVNVSYADNFSDNNNSRNTYAYPTTFTDEDGYSRTTQYNYDFGAVTFAHTPTGGTGTGTTYADVKVEYDPYARIEKATNLTSGGYKKWVYYPSYNEIHTYETLTGTAQADEFHSWKVMDGAGRVRATAADHPGSSGLFAGQVTVYDVAGRIAQQSKPTEMNGATWTPTGADTAWVYDAQQYDWKGRPTKKTNPDGTTRLVSYGGCGCAGGEVATAQDEHGRQRRYTKDALGRLAKTEELNWNSTVYATTQYTYNVRDQLTQINQQGQTRTFEYDGHGRLWKRTTPEQGQMTFTYNTDDTVNVVTDARGATATYSHTSRHQVSGISYNSQSGVAATASVGYLYDAAGNRFWMTDGQGSTFTHYDALGRLDWEERNISGLGGYRLSYEYNPSGELKKITYPSQFGNVQINYGYDKAGRLNSVGGSGYAGVSTYASSISYRAFGAVQGMNYGNNKTLSTAYDNRKRVTKWDVTGVLGYKYYYDDFNEHTGRVTFAQHITAATAGLNRTQTSSNLDRSYEYDQVGRLAISHAGNEARAAIGLGPWGSPDGNYSQGYDYDVWGNMTHRYGWGGEVQGGSPASSTNLHYGYTNNRRNGFGYDAAGNLTFDGGQTFAYDAEGRQVSSDYTDLRQYYDGNGLRVKKTEYGSAVVQHYLRSTVLGGQVVAELNSGGGWLRGFVYAGSQLLAVQQNSAVYFVHQDPVTKSKRVTDMSGGVQSVVELDPFGADTSFSSSPAFQPRKFTSYERDANGTDEAMFRRYNRWHARFDQPDPYEGSYDLGNPQSLNRYAYVGNDPVNFVDPTGLYQRCTTGSNGAVTCVEVGGGPGVSLDGGPVVGFTQRDTIYSGANPFDDPFFSFARQMMRQDDQVRRAEILLRPGTTSAGPQRDLIPLRPPRTQAQIKAEQQKDFDDCATGAIVNFREAERLAIAKIAVGTYATMVIARVTAGASAANTAFDTTAAAARSSGWGVARYSTRYRVASQAPGIATVTEIVTGGTVVSGFNDSFANNAKLDAAIADCAARSPMANHRTLPLFLANPL